jgi:hypothetical protein
VKFDYSQAVNVLAVLAISAAFAAPQAERSALQQRAEKIVRQNQENEITTSEARRRVELLLRDLKKWAEDASIQLVRRTRTFSAPATGPGEVLTADRCPLFFEEDLERLCPLDFSRSEVWGASVVFCRYLCTPEKP